MMIKVSCPTERLPLLIADGLSSKESCEILTHLEECSSCQRALESLSAESSWWERAARGLSGGAVDSKGRLSEPAVPGSFVEALLEVAGSDTSQATTSQATKSKLDQAILDPPSHPEMLGRIDEFDIEQKIGQGGMGIVYRGFDRSLNRPVAIKVMAPHLGANAVARKRFAREAQAAAAVVHPHVVPIYRVNSSADRPYIAMALMDGHSLQDYVVEQGPLDTKDVVRISVQIADGLSAAHRQGLIHRDMKPANILMEKDVSRVMITDFGLARAVDDVAMTQSGCLTGTPNYMSPEQVTGTDIDHRCDLFSLGSVMYFIATGQEPFQSESAFGVINKIISEEPRSARSLNADVPETLDRIIGQLLEKDPADRIQSAEELQELLTQYLAHLQDPKHHVAPEVKETRAARKNRKRRLGLVAAMLGVLTVVVWGFWASANRSGSGEVGEHLGNGAEELEHHDEQEDGEHRGEEEHR